MKILSITLDNEAQTNKIAAQFAAQVSAPLVLGLTGTLGAGKTTFVRAMLRALAVRGPIKSPTYALMESYDCQKFLVHHFDLYRIASNDELELIGFRDCMTESAVCCIEWPENTPLSESIIDVQLNFYLCSNGRGVDIEAKSAHGKQWLLPLAELL